MDDKTPRREGMVEPAAQANDQTPLPDWETPELIVEDVGPATRGGPFGSSPSGDDAWYSS